MDSYDSSAELIFGSSGPWDKTFWTFRFDSGVTRHGKFERSYRLVLYTLIRVSVGGGEPAQAWLQLLRMGRHVSWSRSHVSWTCSIDVSSKTCHSRRRAFTSWFHVELTAAARHSEEYGKKLIRRGIHPRNRRLPRSTKNSHEAERRTGHSF